MLSKNLVVEGALVDAMGYLKETVGQCRFAMIDVSDNREIANKWEFRHISLMRIL